MTDLFDIASPALYLVTGATMTVFVVFGVWSLRERFQKYQEWGLRTQVLVLLGVLVFYVLEINTLRVLLVGEPVYFIFALLGLIAAGLALYGHVLVSLLSRLMVELVVPDNPARCAVPRLGPAEMLEYEEDWEGALNEYYVLAHVFPGNALIYGRIANNLLRLERPDEAVKWFERSLKHSDNPNDALVVLRRLWDACHVLGERGQARKAAYEFIERFPEFEGSRLLLKQLGDRPAVPGAQGLDALSSLEPLGQGAPVVGLEDEWPPGKTGGRIKRQTRLASLEEAPLDEKHAPKGPASALGKKKKKVLLEPMDDVSAPPSVEGKT